MNWGSIIIITIAVLVVIMGIKGTQHDVLPFLFGDTPAAPTEKNPGTIPGVGQYVPANTGSGSKCPSGYNWIPLAGGTTGVCIKS